MLTGPGRAEIPHRGDMRSISGVVQDMSSYDMSTGPSRTEIPHRGDINTLEGEYHRNTHADVSRLAVLRTRSPLRRLQHSLDCSIIKDRI